MASLSPPPKLQFFGTDGLPLVGGKLYTYAAGTTTPLATYVDNTGTTTNTNPVILDSNGQANVWLLNTETYKFILKTPAEVTLYTVDYISVPLTSESFASPPPIGSGTPNAGTFTTLNVTGNAIFESTADFTEPVTFESDVTVDGSFSAVLSTSTGLPLTTGVTGVLPQANGGTGTTTGYYGFKNRIINGAMVIDQRNAGASVTPTTSNYVLDRWKANLSVTSKFSVQQTPSATETGYATRVGAGFSNYLACTSLSAYSVGAGEFFNIAEYIEGYNTADLSWGTASAKTITISFWAYSSLTGTFGGALRNATNDRSYPFTYTISAANTWELKTVTIAGDTSGTWVTNNGIGIQVIFNLGAGTTYSGTAGSWSANNYVSATGATSVVGTNGATFYITGVQLEKGSTATSFDYRPYSTELALCQRYCVAFSSAGGDVGIGAAATASVGQTSISLPVTGRVAPTGIVSSASWVFNSYGSGNGGTGAVTFASATPTNLLVSSSGSGGGGMTVATSGRLYSSSGTSTFYTTGQEL